MILLALMKINRFRMNGGERRRKIHFADHFRLAASFLRSASRRIDDDEIVGRNRTQAHRVRRICFLHPVPVSSAAMEKSRFGQPFAQRGHVRFAEFFVGRERQLERRAFQMIHEDFQVVGLHVRVFRRPPEKIFRMLHDELIERRRRRHQHRARSSAPPPGAPGALPGRRNRTRISRHHARIERSDVDPQFQRIRRHHSAHAPFAQPAFDLASLARQISAAISANRLRLVPACGRFACCKYVSSTSVCSRLLAKTMVCSLRASSSFATRVVSFK